MKDQRAMPVVPTAILDAAESIFAHAGTEDPATELTLREALHAMLTVVLPMYELRLGVELGSVTFACPHHKAPDFGPECIRCARYTALLGARRIIEGRDSFVRPLRALQEPDDGTG